MRLGFAITPATMDRAAEFKAAGINEAELCLFASRDSVEQALEDGGRVWDALTDADIDVWSTHLPTGGMWDICSLDEDMRRRNVQNLTHVMRAAAGWGSKIVVVHGLEGHGDDAHLQKIIDACRRSLDEMSTFAARCGMRVAVENMPRSPLEKSGEILKLMDCCAGLCFDVNHLLLQSHEEFLDDLEKYVITTHLSDYDAGRTSCNPKMAPGVLENDTIQFFSGKLGERHWKPGEEGGIVPWETVCRRLIKAGYRGPWMFEVSMKEYLYTAQEVVDSFLKCSRLG